MGSNQLHLDAPFRSTKTLVIPPPIPSFFIIQFAMTCPIKGYVIFLIQSWFASIYRNDKHIILNDYQYTIILEKLILKNNEQTIYPTL